MKPSTLLSLKAITNKIHPQLPLRSRDYQKLLDILNSSFQRQLDLHHPRHAAADTSPNERDGTRHSAIISTDRHLNTVLSNPLLSLQPAVHRKKQRGNAQQVPQVPDALHAVSNPVGWFKDCVAQGTASLNTARLCLQMALKNTPLDQSHPTRKEQMQKVGAGAAVLDWLRANDLETSSEFHLDRSLTYSLTLFLLAEGRVEVLKHWFTTQLAGNIKYKSWKRHIIENIVKARFVLGYDTNEIAEEFLEFLASASTVSHRPVPRHRLVGTFESSGTHITSKILTQKSPISSNLYDQWSRSAKNWASNAMLLARLDLQHPLKPDASQALELIKSEAFQSGTISLADPAQRRRILQFCLETANVLVVLEQERHYSVLLKYLHETFPEEIGLGLDKEELAQAKPDKPDADAVPFGANYTFG